MWIAKVVEGRLRGEFADATNAQPLDGYAFVLCIVTRIGDAAMKAVPACLAVLDEATCLKCAAKV